MYKKIEELLPVLLRKLSSGIAISTSDIYKEYGFSDSSVRSHLRELENNFFKNNYSYDHSSKKWIANETGFLDRQLLSPEEIVVLNSILRNKNRLGNSMAKWQEKVVQNYRKRASSFIFKQDTNEKVTKKMEDFFALIHTSIDSKIKIKIKYSSFDRVVYPYKIVNIEYYWYLFGFEFSSEKKDSRTKKIKSYTIAKIEDIELLDENFSYDFSQLETKIKHILNAYFKPNESMIPICLLIAEDFVDYIGRARFFSNWKNRNETEIVKNQKYLKFDVWITDSSFQEIIPTILKYIPKILVEEPMELREKVLEKLKDYSDFYR